MCEDPEPPKGPQPGGRIALLKNRVGRGAWWEEEKK